MNPERVPVLSDLCDWNPVLNEDALCNPYRRPDDCPNPATVLAGIHHICSNCAGLPYFKRFKKKPLSS